MLPAAEAVELLRALIGERVAAEPDATTMLADQCSRLPLALRLAAEFAVRRPGSKLAALVGELADQQERLEVLDAGGDRRTALRAVFSWSYQDLPSDAARAFRLHGLDPCPAISLPAAAALIGTTPGRARRLLEQLVQAHLIQRAGPDRYTMHDLLRAYARQLSAADDQQEALTRLFDYYLRTAAAAMNILFPTDSHRRPPISGSSPPSSEMTTEGVARAWLDGELVNLLAVAMHAAGHGWAGHATRLAPTVFRHLLRSCYYAEAASIGRCAWQAAHDTGDLGAEATALYGLGTIDLRRRQYAQASRHLSQSLALFRQIGDRSGQAWSLHNIGVVDFQQGRYPEAARNFQQALARYQEAGDRSSEGRATTDLGLVYLRQGRYPQAIRHFHQALTLARGSGDETCEAYAIGNLADTCLRQGRYQQAATYLEQAMAVFRRIGDPTGEAYSLNTLGDACRLEGRGQEASRRYQQALELFRRISDRAGEAEALNGFGEALFATGHPEQARAQHQSALGIASQIGDQNQQARAHSGLARTCHAADDQDLAASHAREAATLYRWLGVPPPREIDN
jgi:tetratricopeptide (TPR) repeat protein